MAKAKESIRGLEHELQKKEQAFKIQVQQHLGSVAHLEREKMDLEQKLSLLEQKIDAEKLKADGLKVTKELAIRHSLGMKKQ